MRKIGLHVNGVGANWLWTRIRASGRLREDLRLAGAKQSCDRKGQCGARTVSSTVSRTVCLERRLIWTLGGDVMAPSKASGPHDPHVLLGAFRLAGVVECGFCTPGMIMASKALLDQNPNPSEAEKKGSESQSLPMHRLSKDHRCGQSGGPVPEKRERRIRCGRIRQKGSSALPCRGPRLICAHVEWPSSPPTFR